MKKALKYLLIIFVSISIIIILLTNVYRANVLNNLNNKKRIVDLEWKELYENSSNRVQMLKILVLNLKDETNEFDSLKIIIESNSKKQGSYKNECSLDFLKQEYDLNKEYLKFLNKCKRDNTFITNDVYKIQKQLSDNDKKTNEIINQYNSNVVEYNQYLSIFPNFLIAKKNGFKNNDPIIKSKELPEWAKYKDTL